MKFNVTSRGQYCYGCKFLTSDTCGAGGVVYGCQLAPGLVIGEDAHWSAIEDKPVRCEHFEAKNPAKRRVLREPI